MASQPPLTAFANNKFGNTVIPKPGPGKQLIVVKGRLSHRNTTAVVVSLRPDGGAPAVFTVPFTAQDSFADFDFGDGWVLPANEALEAYLDVAGGGVDVNITSYNIIDV